MFEGLAPQGTMTMTITMVSCFGVQKAMQAMTELCANPFLLNFDIAGTAP